MEQVLVLRFRRRLGKRAFGHDWRRRRIRTICPRPLGPAHGQPANLELHECGRVWGCACAQLRDAGGGTTDGCSSLPGDKGFIQICAADLPGRCCYRPSSTRATNPYTARLVRADVRGRPPGFFRTASSILGLSLSAGQSRDRIRVDECVTSTRPHISSGAWCVELAQS